MDNPVLNETFVSKCRTTNRDECSDVGSSDSKRRAINIYGRYSLNICSNAEQRLI